MGKYDEAAKGIKFAYGALSEVLPLKELIAKWVLNQTKISRSDLASQLKANPSVLKATNETLDMKGYSDTIPVYRYVKYDPEKGIDSEKIISTTLDPNKVADNVKFFSQNSMEGSKVPFGYKQVLVRYDVPRENIIAHIPSLERPDSGLNKKIINDGFVDDIKGYDKITDPARIANQLIDSQDEVIANVSGIKPEVLSLTTTNKNILYGNVKAPDDFSSSYIAGDWMNNPSAYSPEAENLARQNVIDKVKSFMGGGALSKIKGRPE